MMPSRGLQAFNGKAPRLYQQQCRNLSSRQAMRSSPLRYPTTPIRSSQWRTQAPTIAFSLFAVRHASTNLTTPSPGPTSAPQAPLTEPASAAASSSQLPNLDTISLDEIELASSSDYLSALPESIGYLKAIGLNYGIGPTSLVEWVLEHMHISAGLPWWGAIAGTAFLFRLVLIPLYIRSADQQARMSALTPITKPISDRMTAAQRAGDQTGVMMAWQELREVRKRAGASMLQQFTPALIQGVLGYCGFKLLRAAAALPVPGFKTDGFLWLQDLTLSDPYLLVPAIMAATMHIMIRVGGETGSQGQDAMAQGMKKFLMWGMPGVIFLVTGWQSGAICVWFATGGAFGMCQALTLQQPRVREFLGITPLYRPPPPEPAESPSMNPQSAPSGKNAAYMRPTYQSPNLRTTRSAHAGSETPRTIDITARPASSGPFKRPNWQDEGVPSAPESKSPLEAARELWKNNVQAPYQRHLKERREKEAKEVYWEQEERARKRREAERRSRRGGRA